MLILIGSAYLSWLSSVNFKAYADEIGTEVRLLIVLGNYQAEKVPTSST